MNKKSHISISHDYKKLDLGKMRCLIDKYTNSDKKKVGITYKKLKYSEETLLIAITF